MRRVVYGVNYSNVFYLYKACSIELVFPHYEISIEKTVVNFVAVIFEAWILERLDKISRLWPKHTQKAAVINDR